MFQHLAGATQGLAPSLVSKRYIANLGMYDVEVIIEPVVPSGGGGYSPPTFGQRPSHFRVTVKVTFKGKVYKSVQIMTPSEARVFAKLKGIVNFTENSPMVAINGVQILEQKEIEVNVSLI